MKNTSRLPKFLPVILFFFSIITCPELSSQYSLDFDGGEDHVVLNGTDIAPPWTFECMVNKSETDNYQHLMTGNDGNSGIRLEQYWGTKVGLTKSGYADWYFDYVAPIGIWKQITITNNGQVTKLYVDGIFISSVNASINFPMKWISKNTEYASLKAKIDELRIWDTVLSDDIIKQYSKKPVDNTHPAYDHLLHYYKFDEGGGNICYDSKGNLNGTIYGASYYIDTDHDAGIKQLVAPAVTPDNYSSSEPLIVKVKNYGSKTINDDFTVSYTLDGVIRESITVNASTHPLLPNKTIDIRFAPVDMNTSGDYHFVFFTSLPGDENPANDTLVKTLRSNSKVLGDITSFGIDGNTVNISCGTPELKVIFYKNDMFRIWLAPDGHFSNPAGNDIVLSYDFPVINVDTADMGDYYLASTNTLALRIYKHPLKFALYQKDNQTLIWQESQGLDYGTRTFQYLKSSPDEYFYGGGMQNGYFSHKGTKIKISKETQNWDDGAVPNPVPFYMSTNGYGAFRNTFAPGEYDFRDSDVISTAHKEERFDCFYFYGPSLKEILNGYTQLTGRPFMPPRWGLELGDADCYNKNGQTTPDVIKVVADKYRENDLPGGWILPNDGYGCGYTDLPYVVKELKKRGFHTGLWTEDGVSRIAWEVGTAGTRACKLDVAWVGAGYRKALNACKAAYQGIENNCEERGYVWSVCGWAGTQRYSVVWSGDQYGGFEFIRFHIPTLTGAGLSGYSLASSDLDGIFGGSAPSYARDIQWKTFIPVYYAMSGWAPKDKHPWNYGTRIMNIARKYLKLKMRLTPYMYTNVHTAHVTGVPVVRAMVLEFPGDTVTWDKTTQYQFMSGDYMLVAPVYSSSYDRDSIYLPEGTWIDYWDGTVYDGKQFLRKYRAKLDKCPVFIKGGAIIPMYSEMLYDGQKPKDTIFWDIYPQGESQFELYEDDGFTREYKNGAFATTLISCKSENENNSPITITVGGTTGDYSGKPEKRVHYFYVHHRKRTVAVLMDDFLLKYYDNRQNFRQAEKGWYFDPREKNGTLHIKTGFVPSGKKFKIEIQNYSSTQNINEEDSVEIYPMPVTNYFNIKSKNLNINSLTVFNVQGQKLYKTSFNAGDTKNIKVDFKNHTPGIYIIRIETDKGIFYKKLITTR